MHSLPKVISSLSEMQSWRRNFDKISHLNRIGFVPTMGALHEGHAKLIRIARKNCDTLVLSIFVNPAQFGPQEDFKNYPRTLEADLKIAAKEGVDIVFLPSANEIYPLNYSTFVEENTISTPLCGAFRPGHFRGVTTIVLKLFNLVQPHIAYFGLKDAQQFFVLKKMIQDLNLDIEIEGVPTVRESDGLALSSRNTYLSPSERRLAPQLYQALLHAQDKFKTSLHLPSSSEKSVDEVFQKIALEMTQFLESHGFKVQYFECLTLPQFNKPVEISKTMVSMNQSYLIAAAAYLGKTRLIDNIITI